MDVNVLINSIWGEFFHSVYVLKCHNVHFKYLTVLYVNYTSAKLKSLKQAFCNISWVMMHFGVSSVSDKLNLY